MFLAQMLACTATSEFEGPGFDSGAFVSAYPGPFLVAATYARPATGEGARFSDHVSAIQEQLADSEGVLGYAFRAHGRDNWTLSIWESEASMYAFMTGGAHLDAMGDASAVLEAASFAHWSETDAAAIPPSWDEALERLGGE